MSNVAVVITDEEVKKKVYKLIDRSLTKSFIGGVLLGLFPFLSSQPLYWLSYVGLVLSCVIFFISRYLGLGFLFEFKEG